MTITTLEHNLNILKLENFVFHDVRINFEKLKSESNRLVVGIIRGEIGSVLRKRENIWNTFEILYSNWKKSVLKIISWNGWNFLVSDSLY